MTPNQFKHMFPLGDRYGKLDAIYQPLLHAMGLYNIQSIDRVSCFLANVAHESREFVYAKEIWGPTAAQTAYEPPTTKAKELGNTEAGDGRRFCGRAYLQCTGRYNYHVASVALHVDYISHPEWMERPADAINVSCWWWAANGCNQIADSMGITGTSRKVNLGNEKSTSTPNGMAARQIYYDRIYAILSRPDFSNVLSGVEG